MFLRLDKYYPEIIGALLCLTLGMLSGLHIVTYDFSWYAMLQKPSFNPPAWIFGPVWTILYLMMGTALGILWKEKSKNKHLITLFIAQFICNLAWSPLFFHLHRIDLGLIDICFLWLFLMTFMFFAKNQLRIFFLLLPYSIWVSFAAILNLSIYYLNVRA